jgi:hypothetical protein
VGLVVAASTDSRNRTIREMKGLVKDFPGAKTSFLRQFCTKNHHLIKTGSGQP